MKKIFCFLYGCLVSLGAVCQTSDTSFVTIATETGVLGKQQIAEQYDYVFGTRIPARWMFKWNPLAGADYQGLLHLSAERKISPAFSLQLAYGVGVGYALDSTVVEVDSLTFRNSKSFAYHHVNLQARWYFDMARRIRQGLQASNFSGNYLGLETAYTSYGPGLRGAEKRFAYSQSDLALRFGVQRRLFRYGYMDISYGLGARRSTEGKEGTSSSASWNFFTSTRFALGLALTSPNARTQNGAYCDVLQCFREENRMFKIDLYNLLRVKDNENVKVGATLAFEQKIAHSPFSVEVQGQFVYRKTGQEDYVYFYDNSGREIGGHIQPRYYYRMNKQIARGKSGNNLSGIYLAWQFAAKHVDYKFRSPFPGSRPDYSAYRTGPGWGLQYRLFKNGFIDLNGGFLFGADVLKPGHIGLLPQTTGVFEFAGNFRVGLVF